MDWNAPMHALWSYFNSPTDGATTPVNQTPTQGPVGGLAQMMQAAGQQQSTMSGGGNIAKATAETPKPGEATVKFYPSKDYVDPTDLNKGTPWAPLQMPVTAFKSLAKADAESRDLNIIDPETSKYILSGGLREGRWQDYGVNQIDVNYKTPPPSHLRSMVANSDKVAADLKAAQLAERDANRKGDVEGSVKHHRNIQSLQANLSMLDDLILKDEKWTGAKSHAELTKKAQLLGLPQSTNQELIRDKDTGKLITKVDRYRPDYNQSQDERAKFVPFALANKIDELGGKAKGLQVYQAFIGGGPLAKIRANQQHSFNEYVTEHPKNKDSHNAYQKTMESFRKKK
jgi:hypothetical protein